MNSDSVLTRKRRRLTRLLRSGSMREAADLGRHLLQEHPEDPELLALHAATCQHFGDYAAFLQAARGAAKARPEHVPSRLLLAEALMAHGATARSFAQARDLERSELDGARGLRAVAEFFRRHGRRAAAERCLQRALALEPDHADTLFAAALDADALGRADVAILRVGRLLELDPEDYEAWYHRSRLQRQSLESNHVEEIVSALEKLDEPDPRRIPLNFALAKELDDVERFHEAAQLLRMGADGRRARLDHDVADDEALMKALSEANLAAPAVDGQDGKGATGDEEARPTSTPVFFVGLPLCGAEPLALTLAAQDGVDIIGAAGWLATGLRGVIAPDGTGHDWPQRLGPDDIARVGAHYRACLEGLEGDALCRVNTRPENFLYLGIIASALPEARIVHVHRHPLDQALALYRTLFRGRCPWSYDLGDLSRYLDAYRALMDHWRRTLDDRLLEIDLDLLLLDPASQGAKISEHLGLPADPSPWRLLDVRQVASDARSRHIRRLLDTNPGGRWRRYAELLEPVAQRLELPIPHG